MNEASDLRAGDRVEIRHPKYRGPAWDTYRGEVVKAWKAEGNWWYRVKMDDSIWDEGDPAFNPDDPNEFIEIDGRLLSRHVPPDPGFSTRPRDHLRRLSLLELIAEAAQ